MAERRGRTTEALNALALSTLSQLPIVQTRHSDDAMVFAVARRYRLTFYDAAYLELALREKVGLATFDTDLARAARAEAVLLPIA
jgi:predicted nucleic acid-binding protein